METSLGASVARVELIDFRCYESIHLDLPSGVTVISGDNGEGKTSILEAVVWCALGRSFRGVPDAALVRAGQEEAVVRTFISAPERSRKIEVGLRRTGRNKILLDGKSVSRLRDLIGALRVTVFAPDDLALIKGGPAGRRTFIDELLTTINPRFSGVRADYEKVLRHRNALLRAGGRANSRSDEGATLEVFNQQLVATGSELLEGRLQLLNQIFPEVQLAYRELAIEPVALEADYVCDWATLGPNETGLSQTLTREELAKTMRAALSALAGRERERGTTLVGPHRDEWALTLAGLESRSQASQGEQRTLALALRLAGHRAVTAAFGQEPVLVLDDVFSELDEYRSAALVERLAAPQTLISTAGPLPFGVEVAARVCVANATARVQ